MQPADDFALLGAQALVSAHAKSGELRNCYPRAERQRLHRTDMLHSQACPIRSTRPLLA